MNGTEENKKLVLEFIGYVSDGNVEKILDCMTDDAVWTVVGHGDVSPAACARNKTEVKKLFEGLAEIFPNGLTTTPRGVTAEGDRVAVETETYGFTGDGRLYNNYYHMLYIVKDGLIGMIREYCDLRYVQFILG